MAFTKTRTVGSALIIVLIAVLSPSNAIAGLCEEQLEIPWRNAVAKKMLPLNIPIHILPDGSLGSGRPNAVIDRPSFNTFQGSIWILFQESQLETFIQTNNQGFIPGCAASPFVAIVIDNKIAPLDPVINPKPFSNVIKITPEARELIRTSVKGPFEIITTINRRFAIGDKTREALKVLYKTD